MLRKHQLIEVPDESPFANDKLQREKSVTTLASLIANAQTPFVVGVTGAWGTGKTTFVRMLEATLRKQGHVCIHHNAWESDFADDPLVGLIEEIGGALASAELSADAKRRVKGGFRKVQGKAKAFLHAVGPLALQIATRGALKGEDVQKYAKIIADSGDDIAKALSKYASASLERHREAKESIQGLREKLAELVDQVSAEGSGAKTPVVFVIDELDRCRPTYAIQLLERVKHIFNVPGIVFVLAIDRDQLCHAIQSVYGHGFDAKGYLRRFIDLGYRLDSAGFELFLYSMWEEMGLDEACRNLGGIEGGKTSFAGGFCPIARVFAASLREIEQTMSQVNVILRLVVPNRGADLGELGLVCALRLGVPSLFDAFVGGGSRAHDLLEEIRKRPLGQAWFENLKTVWVEARLLTWSRVGDELRATSEELKARVEALPEQSRGQTRDAEILRWIQRIGEFGRLSQDSLSHYVSLFDLAEGFSTIA